MTVTNTEKQAYQIFRKSCVSYFCLRPLSTFFNADVFLVTNLTSLKMVYLTNFCQHPGFSAPVGITAISVNTQRNTRKKITALLFQTSLPACSNGIMGNPMMGKTKISWIRMAIHCKKKK